MSMPKIYAIEYTPSRNVEPHLRRKGFVSTNGGWVDPSQTYSLAVRGGSESIAAHIWKPDDMVIIGHQTHRFINPKCVDIVRASGAKWTSICNWDTELEKIVAFMLQTTNVAKAPEKVDFMQITRDMVKGM